MDLWLDKYKRRTAEVTFEGLLRFSPIQYLEDLRVGNLSADILACGLALVPCPGREYSRETDRDGGSALSIFSRSVYRCAKIVVISS